MKNSSSRTAGAEENLFLAGEHEARIAGSECAFAGQGWRPIVCRERVPVFAIGRLQQEKFAVDGITEGQALFFGKASKGVEKELLAIVGVLKLPGFAAVGSLVDARFVSVAAGHDVGSFFAECHHTAKIQRIRIFNAQSLPRLSFIEGF